MNCGRFAQKLTCYPLVALVGSPNVGKSVLFNNLTGRYATVSNYPGTTIEISHGEARLEGRRFSVVDTPGMYSLLSITDEERVAKKLLTSDSPAAVVHVIDAKNLERMLPLTVQLLELGLPVIVDLNMMDEAEKLGLEVRGEAIEAALGVQAVPTVGTSRKGMKELGRAIAQTPKPPAQPPVRYEPEIEAAVARIEGLLAGAYGVAKRGVALLLLQDDADTRELVRAREGERFAEIESVVREVKRTSSRSLSYRIALERQSFCKELSERALRQVVSRKGTLHERLNRLLISPWTGVPLVLLVLHLGLYKFVGQFGAGTLVNLIEVRLFKEWVNPKVNAFLASILAPRGWQYWLGQLVGGEYGIITLALTYALAIILPIVLCFFIFFSILEDTGYMPRLAMMVDSLFKKLGLSGRAVIPMVLGLGCGTMATIVTRVLETKREKLIATLLLALAVPCSAQYGVVAALLAQRNPTWLGISAAFLVWLGAILGIFVLVGWVADKVFPGVPPSFYMELPPLRLPGLRNIFQKTLSRMKWYFLEVLPMFVVASVMIWFGRLTGLFDLLISCLAPAVKMIGLPREAAHIFLYGFFRRDFGAAGLYDLGVPQKVNGVEMPPVLNGVQIVVACVVLTLFVPCIAQFLVMHRERGMMAAWLIALFNAGMAFAVGAILNLVLTGLGVTL